MLSKTLSSLNLRVQSHDFRHAKLTDLSNFLTAAQIRDYAGHSSIRVTDTYLHSNQEDVLKKISKAYRPSEEAGERLLPQKRAAKVARKFDARAVLEANN
jgi:integrase